MNPALIAGIVAGAVMSGTSLLYATLGEIVGERAGVVNLGLEGIMLIGAASGFAVTALTGSPYLGIAAAAVAGAAANLIFAYVVVSRRANQLAEYIRRATVFQGTAPRFSAGDPRLSQQKPTRKADLLITPCRQDSPGLWRATAPGYRAS